METKESGIPELPKTSPETKEEVAVMEKPEIISEEKQKEELVKEAEEEVEVLQKELGINKETSVPEAEKKVEAAIKKEGFLTRLSRVKIIKPILVALSLGLFTPAAFAKKDGSPESKETPRPVKIGEQPNYGLDIEKRQVEVEKAPDVGKGAEKEKENIALLNKEVVENNGELPPGIQKEIKTVAFNFAELIAQSQKTEGVSLSTSDLDKVIYQPLQGALGMGKISYSADEWTKQIKILSKLVGTGGTMGIQSKIADLIAMNIVEGFLNEEAKQKFTDNKREAAQERATEVSETAYDIEKISAEILGDRNLQYPPESYAEFYPKTVRQIMPMTLVRHLGISLEEAEKALADDNLVQQFVKITQSAKEAATGAGGYDSTKAAEVVKAELPGWLTAVERRASLDQATVVGR